MARECPVHEYYKDAVIGASEGDTVLTGASAGDAVRGIKNSLAEKVLEIEKQFEGEEASRKIQEICGGSLRKEAVNGDIDGEGSVVVGQNVGLLKKVQPTEEIMREIVDEYIRIVKAF